MQELMDLPWKRWSYRVEDMLDYTELVHVEVVSFLAYNLLPHLTFFNAFHLG